MPGNRRDRLTNVRIESQGDDRPQGQKSKAVLFQRIKGDSPDFRTWFRGEHMNINPSRHHMVSIDAVRRWVLAGWEPPEPMISPETRITAFGSCFAANISNWLSKRNFRVLTDSKGSNSAYVIRCGEGMVNSFVIRQQFEWAWENKVFELPLWHGYKAEEYGYDPKVRLETKRIFDNTDFFILTLGLSEVWYDEPTGNVFWRTIPKEAYDPARHKFRVSTVEENKENLEAIYKLIRKHRPDATVLLTLSPIPLTATFRNNSCLTSNSASKAVLKVALDEVLRNHMDDGQLYYWPSYEIITDVFRLPYKSDRRHPKEPTLDYIMTLFEHVWCTETTQQKPSLTEAWVSAGAVSGLFPVELFDIVEQQQIRRLRQMIKSEEKLNSNPRTDTEIRRMLKVLLREMQSKDRDQGLSN